MIIFIVLTSKSLQFVWQIFESTFLKYADSFINFFTVYGKQYTKRDIQSACLFINTAAMKSPFKTVCGDTGTILLQMGRFECKTDVNVMNKRKVF